MWTSAVKPFPKDWGHSLTSSISNLLNLMLWCLAICTPFSPHSWPVMNFLRRWKTIATSLHSVEELNSTILKIGVKAGCRRVVCQLVIKKSNFWNMNYLNRIIKVSEFQNQNHFFETSEICTMSYTCSLCCLCLPSFWVVWFVTLYSISWHFISLWAYKNKPQALWLFHLLSLATHWT